MPDGFVAGTAVPSFGRSLDGKRYTVAASNPSQWSNSSAKWNRNRLNYWATTINLCIDVHRWIVNDCEIESCNRTELSPLFLRFCPAKTFGYKWSRWWWSCFVSASKISWRSRKHFPPSQWGTHSGLSSYVQFSRLPALDRVWRCMKTKSVSPVCFKSVMSFGTCTILWHFHVIRRENRNLWFLDVSCIVEYSDLESRLSFKVALIRRKIQLEELPHRSLSTDAMSFPFGD